MQEPYNISLYPGSGTADGRRGDHILIAPAYNITENDIHHIVNTTVNVIKQYFREYARNHNGGLEKQFRASLGMGQISNQTK